MEELAERIRLPIPKTSKKVLEDTEPTPEP